MMSGSWLQNGNGRECITTYIRDIRPLVLSEFFVVAQEEDGVFQGQSMVKVTLGLSLGCALYLETEKGIKVECLCACMWHSCVHMSSNNTFCISCFKKNASLNKQKIFFYCLFTFSNSARKLSRVSSDSLPTSNMVTAWLFRFWKDDTQWIVFDYDNAFSNKPFSLCECDCVCPCYHSDTNRWQVAHHEEGCEGGVEEKGDPLGGCSWDAQAADAACVCWRDTHTHKNITNALIIVTLQLHGFVILQLRTITCDFLKWNVFTLKPGPFLKQNSHFYTCNT